MLGPIRRLLLGPVVTELQAEKFILFHENKNLNASFYAGFALIALSVVLQMARIGLPHIRQKQVSVREK